VIGETLGRYRIVATIGSGGMGVVYRAFDPTLEREVALKLLNSKALDSTSARDRFLREARALSQLNHPHICTIYEIGDTEGRTFIAMEYVRGRPLSALIPADGLPTESMVRYGAQIADAIGHAHAHGVVHRDLKSANVVVTPESAVKVLDFGLAKQVESDPDRAIAAQEASRRSTLTAGITQPGVVMGTPGYMAPEVLVGQPADARADIWALGVILHEMATGTLPFTGPTPLEMASAILKESPTPLPARVSPTLRRIVQRCLAKDVGLRYQTAGEVRAALEAAGPGSAPEVRPVRPVVRRTAFAVVSVLAAVAITAVALNWSAWRSRPATAPIRSVAVLPLENLSGDPEQEYFADGMTEQLTADLSSITTLRVISRTSAMQYKGAGKPLSTIARELNVDAVVEGSIVRAGERVRITARLIQAATEEIVWARSYERDLRDVLALQGEVARSIAGEIGITLTAQEQTRLASARPVDPEAHRLFLLGRFHANQGSEEGLKKAVQHFDLAIAKDPGYASAHTGLAEAYVGLSSFYVHPEEAMPKAKAAVQTALRLDESLADAHAVAGYIHLIYDWDGPAAARELDRAIQLNPNLSTARLNYAAYLSTQGRRDESVAEVRQAVELDPLSLRAHSEGASLLLFAQRYDEAIDLAGKALELDPNFAFALVWQGVAYAEKGRFQEAVASLQKAARLDKSPTILALGAHVHAVGGQKREAAALIREVEEAAEQRYFCPYEIGAAYVSLGDFDSAYKRFRQGVEDKADCMAWLGVEPWIEPFRSDPRYAQLLRDVGLAPGGRGLRP
jgi:TolB-like protein/tRNA A-37 threonylcarbamoyl transferase component Bud32/Tfp pilus assembly protein PilF